MKESLVITEIFGYFSIEDSKGKISGQQDCSGVKDTGCQAWWSEFDSLGTHGWRREANSLASTCALYYVWNITLLHSNTPSDTQTNVMKFLKNKLQ